MFSGSTIARAILLLVAAAAATGLYSVYGSRDDGPTEAPPASAQSEPSPADTSSGPATPQAAAPAEPEPARQPDPPAVASPAPAPASREADPAPTAPSQTEAQAAPVPATGVAAENETSAAPDLLDLNSASLAELNKLGKTNKLKGIPAFSRTVVKNRPYKSVEELLKRKIINRAKYERIKDQVTVR